MDTTLSLLVCIFLIVDTTFSVIVVCLSWLIVSYSLCKIDLNGIDVYLQDKKERS